MKVEEEELKVVGRGARREEGKRIVVKNGKRGVGNGD